VAERGKEAGPAAADGTTTQWETYASSAIGADHRRDHSPNQDAVALKRFGPPGPDSLAVLAVADGHGDARHFRSDRGSKLAVTAAVAAAGSWAASISAGAVPSRAAAGQLVSDLVARWRDAVHADLAEYPVGSGQAGAIREGDPPEIPYGTTLLLIAARADVAVLAQIGDGDIFLVGHDGRLITPVPGDRRLDGTQTTSLCQPDAVSAFRMALVSLARTPVYAIFAATDGYGNAQAEPDWKARWAADLVGLGRAYGAGWIGEQLKDWVAVCASSDGSGDDTTAALALNPTATAARSAPAKWPPPAKLLPPAAGPTPDTRPTLVARPDRRHSDPAPDDLTTHPHVTVPADPQWQPEPAGRSGDRFMSSLLLRTTRTRWWLVGAIALAIAGAVYVLLTALAPGPVHPTISPTPIRTASHTPTPTPSPTPSPSPSPTLRHTRTPSSTPTRTAQPSATRTARQKTTTPAVSLSGGRPTSRAAKK